MKIDALINDRFEELRVVINAIIEVSPEDCYPVGIGWGTSALSLLSRVFGEDSFQYKEFQEQFASFKASGVLHILETCRAVFMEAKRDYEGGYLFEV
jgi:hypothetical protein